MPGHVGLLGLLLPAAWACRDAPATDAMSSACDAEACGKRGGECLLSQCVVGGGTCARQVDCDDANPCTVDRCVNGACESRPRSGTCDLEGKDGGGCVLGVCEAAPECAAGNACPKPVNECRVLTCAGETCSIENRKDGAECHTLIGRLGSCATGVCAPGPALERRSCRVEWLKSGPVERCTGGVVFELTVDKVRDAERQLEQAILKGVRYDARVALVAVAGGGYNIIVLNRRGREDIRGLIDPSFVAWTVADYTAKTDWRSHHLHVWLAPYREGWGMSTRGSRGAIQAGKDKSVLGFLGVVDVQGFRTYLEREFHRLSDQ